MERQAMQYLNNWKDKKNRKPIIIKGARQVGKTWLLREFGKSRFKQTAYVNFESSNVLKNLFIENFDIKRIISAIGIETGLKINASDTLIILDEIQDAEGGITALKYFYENAPEYYITAAGSLLGITLHKQTSFPVGKVDFIDLYPLNFEEFLLARGEQQLLELIYAKDWKLVKQFKQKYITLLRQYYYVGGMPEAILYFSETEDYIEVRQIQNRILASYDQDFSKHAPTEIVPRIRMLWNAIPAQLAKENRKFIYSAIKKGSRAKDFELALSWLSDCGLVHKVNRVSKPGIPLKAYEDFNAFKLFSLDLGLLAAMGNISAKTLLNGNVIFEEFKGALTEQYVLQQLKTMAEMGIYYWSSEKSSGEIDFILQHEENIFPVEVKAEENLQAKSLKAFCQKYPNTIAVRTSMSDYRKEDWITNIPLYSIFTLTNYQA